MELTSRLQQTPIAVIGMASIFPQAKNLRGFWDKIVNKTDCITDVPENRWKIRDYYDPDPRAPDKTYCKLGGFLPDITFDPMEFGMPPNILEVTDVSQLLSLIIAREVLEDAGYGESRECDRDRIGIVLGVGGGQKLISPLNARLQYPIWKEVMTKSGISEEDAEIIADKIKKAYIPWEENSFPGMLGNVISGRITNRLDLGGVNCVIDAACASSLAAMKMAVSELLEYRSDIMITGGVDTDNSIHMYLCFSKTPAFTKGDMCRPFDADAGGMLIGEGIGMVALKRLDDAERDNDRIYAVIRGVGTSSDGRFKSIYNPRPEGQAKALRAAYKDAGFHPSTIGLVEAHGTGTEAGDPAEFSALNDVFSEEDTRKQHIALGSVKSQIGHTKAAAGAAGFIKAVLALHHKILPATINVSSPDPKLGIENTPFYLNTDTRPWIHSENGFPRRAGVSSFGFGGTNFHFVLEEYQNKDVVPYRLHSVPQVVLFSGPSPEDLLKQAKEILVSLESDTGEARYQELIRASQALVIAADHARFGFAAESLAEACELLQLAVTALQNQGEDDAWHLPKGIYYRHRGMNTKGRVVALFAGQGSQYLEMGKDLVSNFPPLMEAYQEMDRLFLEEGLPPVSEKVFPIPMFDTDRINDAKKELQRTENAQPAIGVFSVGLYKILAQAGFQHDFAAGHSFGELTALWSAQVLSDKDFFSLAKARGQAMAAPADPSFDAGTMLAVIGDVDAVQEDIREFPSVSIANLNSKKEVVVAGPTADMDAVQKSLKDKGYRVVPLPVSAAFHTSLVAHAQKPFAQAIGPTPFNKLRMAVYSNTTGRAYPSDPDDIKKVLKAHMLNPVKFKDQIENIYQDGGDFFVEFGPRAILTKLVGDVLKDKPHTAVALNPNPGKGSDLQLRQAVVQLRVAGMPLKDVDPYGSYPSIAEGKKRSAVSVTLSGYNYVSDKTRKAYLDALNDGHQIKQTAMTGPRQGSQESTVAEEPESMTPGPSPGHSPTLDSQRLLESVEQSLNLFYKHQSETLQVHEQYLNSHQEYCQTFYELMRQQQTLFDSSSSSGISDSVARNMDMFHNYQGETLRAHDQYLRSQADTSRSALQVIKEQLSLLTGVAPLPGQRDVTAPPPPALASESGRTESPPVVTGVAPAVPVTPVSDATAPPTMPSAAEVPDIQALTQSMLDVVSDKTGYPTEMLELDMEIEADLGIDSIKRVEIIGAMMELHPGLPEFKPLDLAELRTLGQIVEAIEANLPAGGAVAGPAAPVAVPSALEIPDIQALTQSMLDVVSDKTGYPTEMLELDMEIEADLGIDSIKRVEIIGAMMELYPGLPEFKPEEQAELRTLGQIVEAIEANLHPGEVPAKAVSGESAVPSSPSIPMPEWVPSQVSPAMSSSEEGREQDSVPQGFARLRWLPAPDFMAFTLPDNHTCLITDDGSSTTVGLAETLAGKGWKVVVLSFPSDTVPEGPSLSPDIPHVVLTDLSEDHLRQTLQTISSTYGQISGFIHLNPITRTDSDDGILFSETAKDTLRHVFLTAKHLKASLTRAGSGRRPFFVTVARLNGMLGMGGGHFGVIDGGLFGLTKTLNLEWEQVFCRAIDLDPIIDHDQAVSFILQELHDPDTRIVETGYGPQGRMTLVPGELAAIPLDQNREGMDPSSVFLVSGGARVVTAACVTRLAATCKGKYLLLGRTAFSEDEPDWARGCLDEEDLKKRVIELMKTEGDKPTPVKVQQRFQPVLANREIAKTLSLIRKAGGEAEYVNADVADDESIRKISSVADRFGKITGIIHGAGILADRLIEDKTVDDFEAVFRTKVKGLASLLQCVDTKELKHLILFSSAAGFFGNPAQSDYAIANEILNKTACQFKYQYPNCHVTAFNWGPWDGGMVTDSLKKMFAERNIQVIPMDLGTKAFVDDFTADRENVPQILVGSSMQVEGGELNPELHTYRFVRKLDVDANPFLGDHVIGGHPVLPAVCVMSWMADACAQLYHGYRFFRCEDYRTLKGIVFDEAAADEYFMDIREIRKNSSQEIVFEAMLSSQQSGNKLVQHYRAQVFLLPRRPQAPIYRNLDLTESRIMEGETFYQNGTLFHGPSFQAVDQVINLTDEKLTLRCHAPEIAEKKQGCFPLRSFNPYAADAMFQAMLIWAREFHDAGSLPSLAQNVEQFCPLPAAGRFYVSLEVRKRTKTSMTADVIAHDEAGTIYMQMLGAEVTMSKNLNTLFPSVV